MECSFVICKADYKANTTLQHPLPITFGNILKYWQVEEGGGGTERTNHLCSASYLAASGIILVCRKKASLSSQRDLSVFPHHPTPGLLMPL